MKINFNNSSEEVLSLTPLQEQEVGVSFDDQEKILYMLSQGNYKEPINSTIRESVSNAIDAQIEAGIDCIENPVVVGVDDKMFWVKDQGVGIDEKRMNIIAKLGASTKDNRDDQIGFFGIGFFAVHSYTDSFMVESVKDGVKRTWIVGKNGIKKVITLTNTLNVEESNGTTIIVPLKNNDLHHFRNAIKETLVYFKGVIAKGFDEFNKLRFVEGEHYIYREGTIIDNALHIVLDQVLYEINPKDIGLVSFPVALKFDISDGLIPTPSRENIILDENTKEVIRNKVKSAFLELEPKIISSKPQDDLFEYLKHSRHDIYIQMLDQLLVYFKPGNYDFYIAKYNREPCTIFKPLIPEYFISDINSRSYDLLTRLITNFEYVGYFKWNGIFSRRDSYAYRISQDDLLVVDVKLTSKFIDFLKSKNLTRKVLIKYSPKNSLYKYKKSDFLNLYKYPKKDWRNIIIAWQKEEERSLNNITKLSSFNKEFEDWLSKLPKKSYTSKALGDKDNNEITIRLPELMERYSDRYNMKFEPKYESLDNLKRKVYIYSTEREEVDKLYDLWRSHENIIPCMLNKTEIHKVEGMKNFMDYNTFLKGNNKFIQKWVTASFIISEINSNETLSCFFIKGYYGYKKDKTEALLLKTILTSPVKENIKNITNYIDTWSKYNTDETLKKHLIKAFKENNLMDLPMLSEWEYIKNKLLIHKGIESLSMANSKQKALITELVLLKKKNDLLTRKLKHCNDKC